MIKLKELDLNFEENRHGENRDNFLRILDSIKELKNLNSLSLNLYNNMLN